MNGHVGDDAELYALGLLPPDERPAFEQHLAVCSECLRATGEAEATAAALAAPLDRVTPSSFLEARVRRSVAESAGGSRRSFSRTHVARYAVAAAFALALGGSLVRGVRLEGEVRDDNVALSHLIHSHFSHAALSGRGVAGKVLYAPDGSWLYVIADRAPPGARVRAGIDGSERDLGSLTRHERVWSLFVRHPGRAQTLSLQAGDEAPLTIHLP